MQAAEVTGRHLCDLLGYLCEFSPMLFELRGGIVAATGQDQPERCNHDARRPTPRPEA